MATAKKLSSGAWRTQASKVVNGQKLKKSFKGVFLEFGRHFY